MLDFFRRKGVRLCVMSAMFLTIAPVTSMAAVDSSEEESADQHVLPKEGLNTWVPTGDFDTSSLIKVPRFLDALSGNVTDRQLELSAVRNEQVSAQLAVASTDDISKLEAAISDLENEDGDKISPDHVQIRYADYVPVEEKSDKTGGSLVEDVAGRAVSGDGDQDVVADPLLEVPEIDVPDHEAQPIWFTFDIPKSAHPGDYQGEITVKSKNDDAITYDLDLSVDDVEIPDPEDYTFNLDVWMNPNAIAEAYDEEPWESEAYWDMVGKYMKDLAESGQSAITTTIMQNPWLVSWNDWEPQTATGYDTMVDWKYDGGNWDFDYSKFDRYVQTGLDAGMGPDINAYSLLTFRGDQRITYLDEETGKTVTKVTDAGSELWTEAWTAFLNDFSGHLKEKGWMDQTYLSFDERPADLMSQVLDLIEENAPEFLDKTQVAGTDDVSPFAQRLSLGLDSLNRVSDDWIKKRKAEGKETTYYAWAGDNHPNSLSYSPAVESRMMPWISADRGLDGLLHWAYNNWPEDVFHHPVYAFSQGDEYFIYPGEDGPMSSIRWELIKEGVEDYELFQMAKEENGDRKVVEKAAKLAAQQRDGREKNVHDVVLARDMVVSQLVTKNAADMAEMADRFQDADAFSNDQAAHVVKRHLTAVSHFENTGAAEKVVKHLRGFKQLLDEQLDQELLSEAVYETLYAQADALIEKWQG